MALTDEAIDKIKQMILSGRVRPGEKLPREADLAAELGLSRNSLRELDIPPELWESLATANEKGLA